MIVWVTAGLMVSDAYVDSVTAPVTAVVGPLVGSFTSVRVRALMVTTVRAPTASAPRTNAPKVAYRKGSPVCWLGVCSLSGEISSGSSDGTAAPHQLQ